VTVLKANPVTGFLSCVNEPFSNTALSLTERQNLQFFTDTSFLCQSNKVSNWVCTWRQHKNNWGDIGGIIGSTIKIKWRALNKLSTKFLTDESFYSVNQFFFFQTLDNHQFLES